MTLKIVYKAPLSTPPQQTYWPDLLNQKLIKRNQQIVSQLPNRQLLRCPRLLLAFGSNKTWIQRHNYTLQSHGEGPHSQYLPLSNSVRIPNQIDLCFPYIEQLSTRKSEEYQEELFQIVKKLPQGNNYEEWRAICKDLSLSIDLVQLIHIYLSILARGLGVLLEFAQTYKCNPKYLFFKVMQLRKLFQPNSTINRVQHGDKISLDSLSRTCKILYCPICLCYDCTKHQISENVVSHNYKYIRRYDGESRLKLRKEHVINIFRQIVLICSRSKPTAEVTGCSQQCYKMLNGDKWDELVMKRKNKAFSHTFRVIIQMGKELFQFNPCKMVTLFGKGGSYDKKPFENQVRCCDIFYYFINDYALQTKLEYKFYESQIQFLKNQPKEHRNLQLPKKRVKNKGKSNKKHKNNTQSFNAVCFHYFSNSEPEDVGCFNCECRKRGYCLSECQCSELCMIQLKGCRCKASAAGCLTNCPCYKQGRICIPDRCLCFHSYNDGCGNWCENNQLALSSAKLTRVGQSDIEGAGLGLFAGEHIRKNQFVIKYTGQIIESQSIEKLRQIWAQNGVFYNFKLNHQASIDSRTFGNKSRFINHSLQNQNLRVETVNIREQQLLIFRALRDIKQGEQLFFNYNGGGDLTDHKDKYPFIE